MSLKFRIFAVCITLCCFLGLASSQQPANSPEKEDLKDLLIKSGYDPGNKLKLVELAFENPSMRHLSSMLRSYVKYGSREAERKWEKGDQFDKAELKKIMITRAPEVKSKVIVIKKLPIIILEKGDVEKDGLFVRINLPLRIRSKKAFSEDLAGYSGNLEKINVSELDVNRFAFLTKDESLQICSYQESQLVLKNDGILYHPEVENSALILNIKDKYEIMRDIAKFNKSYIFDIEFTNLRVEQPDEWGFYRQKSYNQFDMDCERLQLNVPRTIKLVAPDYFVTNNKFATETQKTTPEIIMALVNSINVRKPDGTVIGSYINKSK